MRLDALLERLDAPTVPEVKDTGSKLPEKVNTQKHSKPRKPQRPEEDVNLLSQRVRRVVGELTPRVARAATIEAFLADMESEESDLEIMGDEKVEEVDKPEEPQQKHVIHINRKYLPTNKHAKTQEQNERFLSQVSSTEINNNVITNNEINNNEINNNVINNNNNEINEISNEINSNTPPDSGSTPESTPDDTHNRKFHEGDIAEYSKRVFIEENETDATKRMFLQQFDDESSSSESEDSVLSTQTEFNSGQRTQQVAPLPESMLAAALSQEPTQSDTQTEANPFVALQAEESDEEGGVRSLFEDDEENGEDLNADLPELVSNEQVETSEVLIRQRFAEQQLEADAWRVRSALSRKAPPQFLGLEDEVVVENRIDVGEKAQLSKRRITARSAAFFSSVNENLLARPCPKRECSVEEGLQFLRTVSGPSRQLPLEQVQLSLPREPVEHNTARKTALKVRKPTKRPSQVSQMHTTYAAQIAAATLRPSEIINSLGRPKQPKKAKTLRPAPKPRRVVECPKTAPAVLGSRSWS